MARRRLAADLSAAGVFGPAVGDAALVVSELLSNAMKHAWPLPGEKLQVTWKIEAGFVKVAVSDGGGPGRPHPVRPAVTSLGGRGLDIVDRLSRNWGIATDNVGQTVWAVLPAPRPAGPGDPAGSGQVTGLAEYRPAEERPEQVRPDGIRTG